MDVSDVAAARRICTIPWREKIEYIVTIDIAYSTIDEVASAHVAVSVNRESGLSGTARFSSAWIVMTVQIKIRIYTP